MPSAHMSTLEQPWWVSLDAVKAFAGEEYALAVHYPGDERFDLVPDPYVFHHEVASMEPL